MRGKTRIPCLPSQHSPAAAGPAVAARHGRLLAAQPQAGKPDRHTHTITGDGRDQLHRWLAQPPELHKKRAALLLKPLHARGKGPAVMSESVKSRRAPSTRHLCRSTVTLKKRWRTKTSGRPRTGS